MSIRHHFAFTLSLATLGLIPAGAEAHIKSEIAGYYPKAGEVERLAAAVESRLDPAADIQLLATGFNWAEGPVWSASENVLLFSDVPENIVYQWLPNRGISIFLRPAGFTGRADEASTEPGANGLAFDAEGRLMLCQHGDRRVARLNPDGRSFSTLAARFEGKRLNSPNDLVRDRHGNIYFTDPPYGLTDQTVGKELEQQGVYRLSPIGQLELLTTELARPNGVGLSPDERTLYVSSTDGAEPWIIALPLDANGHRAGDSRRFFDGTALIASGRHGGFDGLKVDVDGYVWATGPGGVLILSPTGEHLGSLLTGKGTANVAFGGEDGTTLFITADDSLLCIPTKTTWVGRGW